MLLSINIKLYDDLFSEIKKLQNEVAYRKSLNAYRKNIKNSRQRKDYPAVSVGAEFKGICAIGHHHAESSKNDFHPLIYQELLYRLGHLNAHSSNCPNCKFEVGHCAENYAASGVLKKWVGMVLLVFLVASNLPWLSNLVRGNVKSGVIIV